MAQGEFTKEEAAHAEETLKEIMESMSKEKCIEFVGHFNDLFLFIEAAKAWAPQKVKLKARK